MTSHIPFISNTTFPGALHISASVGGGPPHTFVVDTGSVGILVPRTALGPAYQTFDPSQDIAFGYVSSGNSYSGQWVKVPIVLGVPPNWDGTGTYPTAHLEVFAVDQPASFNGGLLGIGFAIGGMADGGPARNPLLHLTYNGAHLSPGYIIGTQGIDVGLTSANTQGFSFIPLQRNPSDQDWQQPQGTFTLSGGFSAALPFLFDTGIPEMILWTSAGHVPPGTPASSPFAAGITVRIAAPPALEYSFVTGDTSQPVSPSYVEWRKGNGLNTGRSVLAAFDYLYDASAGRIAFRGRQASNNPLT